MARITFINGGGRELTPREAAIIQGVGRQMRDANDLRQTLEQFSSKPGGMAPSLRDMSQRVVEMRMSGSGQMGMPLMA